MAALTEIQLIMFMGMARFQPRKLTQALAGCSKIEERRQKLMLLENQASPGGTEAFGLSRDQYVPSTVSKGHHHTHTHTTHTVWMLVSSLKKSI